VSGDHRARDLGESAAALMDDLTAIVSRAAAAIRKFAPAGAARRTKADRTPVSEADEAAEAVLLDDLARLMPTVPVVSEEACARDEIPRLGAQFFLVDPLDGTREFLAGRDEFTINVAIVADGRPRLGIVAAPAQGLLWRGVEGHGAERLHLSAGAPAGAAGERVPIRARPAPAAGLVAAVSRSHLDAATQAFLARLPVAERIACGSAVKFCLLAEGTADVYPRLSNTCEWDVAAGHALLAAAGGSLSASDGKPLRYGRIAESFRVPAFIAWGDPSAPARLAPEG
jgi:3'(2'), 5'-bisphosphate nucleotidase